jgi:hypothetical protein
MKPTIHLNGIEETLNDQLVVTHVYTDGTFANVCAEHDNDLPAFSTSGASYSGVRHGAHRGQCYACEECAAPAVLPPVPALTVATQDGIVATDLETGEVTSSIARSPHVTRHVFANGTTFAACDDHLDMVPGDKLSKSEPPYRTVDRCDECEHRATVYGKAASR